MHVPDLVECAKSHASEFIEPPRIIPADPIIVTVLILKMPGEGGFPTDDSSGKMEILCQGWSRLVAERDPAVKPALIIVLLFLHSPELLAQALDLPDRPSDAPKGAAFARSIAGLPLKEREESILAEVKRGNVPPFLRSFVPVEVSNGPVKATYLVAPDYLAIGSDDDYFLTPITPNTAQKIADLLDCTLPTSRMVDDIYANASIKLAPSPIPPTPAMTTVPVFLSHNETVLGQRMGEPPGRLVAGHKKDVVIANKVFAATGKVAIYGWHKAVGKPIQPLYTGHTDKWVDYSHGIRLVRRRMLVDGQPKTVDAVLADPELAGLLSHEGVMLKTRYDSGPLIAEARPASPGASMEVLQLDPGVRVAIDRPEAASSRPVLLIFYALPNGNTIEQTVGKELEPGDDWHFDIQQIGAQTRFLREAIDDREVVVAYLENDLKSWPVWRKKHGDGPIPAILGAVTDRFEQARTRVALSGHSGGGSLIFGYLNGVEAIPDRVERIAFLDANYGYETDRHLEKLASWLKAADRHYLCVLAYNDAVALLNGKTFVSAEGGTWGRSHLMLRDLETSFPFTNDLRAGLRRSTALEGRVEFLLKENPDRKVLHTVQVEKNGFIESMLSGTKRQGSGYTYFGDRAYSRFIRR
jgi:hypothetical protein